MATMSRIYTLISVLMFLTMSITGAENTLPDFIQVCHKSDPKLDECIKRSIENLRPHLVKGIPEMDVPPLDPFYIGDLVLLEKDQNGFSLKANNISAYGTGDFVLKSLKVVDFGDRYDFQVGFPNLKVEGTYNIIGKLLMIPITGNGKFVGNFNNFVGDVKLITGTKEINGVKHYTIKDITIKIKAGKGTIHLHDLFGGNKSLGDAVNDALNQNFDALNKELNPLIEKALAKEVKATGLKIMDRFTYDQLLPE